MPKLTFKRVFTTFEVHESHENNGAAFHRLVVFNIETTVT